jgi:hypothetical protein
MAITLGVSCLVTALCYFAVFCMCAETVIHFNFWQALAFGSLAPAVPLWAVMSYRAEKREWNNGICFTCNEPLRLFDCDSQGGRGYICSKRHGSVWISYPVDGDYQDSATTVQ